MLGYDLLGGSGGGTGLGTAPRNPGGPNPKLDLPGSSGTSRGELGPLGSLGNGANSGDGGKAATAAAALNLGLARNA